MTINTSTEAVKAIIYGLRQLTNEWVASNAANLIEALLAERDCSETKAGEAMREAIERHAKAGQELAEYASYAEIVGGISVNQPAIRKWCDEVLKANRDVQDAKDALAALSTTKED